MNLKTHSTSQLIGILDSESSYIDDNMKKEASDELKRRKKLEAGRKAQQKQTQKLWSGVDQTNPFVI